MVNAPASSHPALGSTNGGQSPLCWLSIILVSSSLVSYLLPMSWKHSRSGMKYQSTGLDLISVEWKSNGIMTSQNVKSACQTTSKSYLLNTNTHPQHPLHKHVPIKYRQTNQEALIKTWHQIRPRCHGHTPLLCICSWCHSCFHPQCQHLLSKQRSKSPLAGLLPIPWLHCHAPTFLCLIPCQWYDLAIHTDASYHSKSNAKSWATTHFYLTNNDDPHFNISTILALSSIITHVIDSVHLTLWLQIRHPLPSDPWRDGSLPTINNNHNRQHHSHRTLYRNHAT